jgi:hypothetical protein
MTGYTKELQSHLAAYKQSRLGVREAGIFLHKGVEIRCGHILPRDLKWLNILEPYRSEIHQYISDHPDVRLHKFFHHLNSSQAFALNLFFPFFENGHAASTALASALGVKGTVTSWMPEYVPDADEGTNVDVAWQNKQGDWTYGEVKLTEAEFGTAKGDPRHLEKLSRIYGPVLAPYCPASLLQPDIFFGYYQILRNVWLAARNPADSVVFLLPRKNEGLWKPLREVVSALEPSLRNRIHVAAMEDVLKTIANDKGCPPKLSWYAELLAEKYVPPKSVA